MLPNLILVGLGNPGDRYLGTRHNLGFVVLDILASRHRASWRRTARTYDESTVELPSSRLVLIKPKTYVNRSGRALRDFGGDAGIDPDELLVLADDIALPLGQLRLRRKGSDGGHNGLASIIEDLGTIGFARLRMGVGPVPPRVDPADFVLDRFLEEERPAVERVADRAVRCIEDLVESGFDHAMGLYNAPEPDPETD